MRTEQGDKSASQTWMPMTHWRCCQNANSYSAGLGWSPEFCSWRADSEGARWYCPFFFFFCLGLPFVVLVTEGNPKANRASETDAVESAGGTLRPCPWHWGSPCTMEHQRSCWHLFHKERVIIMCHGKSTCFLVYMVLVAHFTRREGTGYSQWKADTCEVREEDGWAGTLIRARMSPSATLGQVGFTVLLTFPASVSAPCNTDHTVPTVSNVN